MAESLESAAFRHGPFELAGRGLAAIVLATEPETRSLDLSLSRDLVDAGASVLVVTPDGDAPKGALAAATRPPRPNALLGGLDRPCTAACLAALGQARQDAWHVHPRDESDHP